MESSSSKEGRGKPLPASALEEYGGVSKFPSRGSKRGCCDGTARHDTALEKKKGGKGKEFLIVEWRKVNKGQGRKLGIKFPLVQQKSEESEMKQSRIFSGGKKEKGFLR